MKQLLGSLVIMLMFTEALDASYRWSIHANKSEAVVHEAVEVVLRCHFSDTAYGYFIELQQLTHPDYEIKLLFETEAQETGKEYYEYRYVLFPKKAGDLVLNFHALMQQTTKESIENSVIGRDNVEDLSFDSTSVALPPLHLHVKPSSAQLVGEMNLSLHADTTTVSAYKPLHLNITLEGVGNLQQVAPFVLDIPDATVFAEKPDYAITLTAQGYRGKVTQNIAVVSREGYDIPSLQQQYWHLATQKIERLETAPLHIEVTPAYRRETLLDMPVEKEMPQVNERDWIVTAFVLFVLGFITGRYLKNSWVQELIFQLHRIDTWLWPRRDTKASQKRHNLRSDIRHCRTPQALSVYLTVVDSDVYGDIITALESETIALATAKKEALKRTDTV